MNKSDSERVRTVIDRMGYAWTDREEEADLLGILACSVREKAIHRVYTRIHKWNQWKNQRNVLTFVSGCVLPADKIKFLKLFDFVYTMNELPNFPDMVRQYGIVSPRGLDLICDDANHERTVAPDNENRSSLISIESISTNRRAVMDGLWRVPATPSSKFEAFVPIQNGCDKFCTFCAVPYTRGREVSRPSEDILAEVDSLVSRGYKSITLLGQNVNSYGLDKPGTELSFANLLQHIGEIGSRQQKLFWLYFTSPHPRDMGDDVLDVISRYPCLGNWIHLPLQSGDDRVLRRMNRQHSVSQYARIVRNIRTLLPDATLFTDIIVGFTSETEAEFENTRRAFEEFSYDMAYIALYSPRPGAASSRWADDVPLSTKRRRFHILNDLLEKQAIQSHQRLVGRTLSVLVTHYDAKNDALMGQTEGKLKIRLDACDSRLIGSFVDVNVTSTAGLALCGEIALQAVAT